MMQQEMDLKTQSKFMAQLQSRVTSDEFIIGGISIENNNVKETVCKFLDANLHITFQEEEIKSR